MAVKILDKFKLENKAQKLLAREILIMEKLAHPNVIRIYEVCETISKLHIVTEYCGGGELLSRINQEGRIAEKDAKGIFAQLVAAVDHLHTQGIVHRDIKAENVYFSAPALVKLGDFGFSTLSTAYDTLTTCCGSPPYAAPELFKEAPYVGVLVDVWALGVLLYFMVSGVMPFRADNVPKLKPVILSGRFQIPDSVSPLCSAVICGLLKVLPPERLSLTAVRRSAWLDGVDFPACWSRDGSADLKARAVMTHQYGVPEELLVKHQSDVRNAISGTYRLLLHQMEKLARNEEHDVPDDGYGSYNSMSEQTRERKTSSSSQTKQQQQRRFGKPISSACSIL